MTNSECIYNNRESLIELYNITLYRSEQMLSGLYNLAINSVYTLIGIIGGVTLILYKVIEISNRMNIADWSLYIGMICFVDGILLVFVSQWGKSGITNHYKKWLEIIATIDKIEQLLGLHDEIPEKIKKKLKNFKKDKYILPSRFIEKGTFDTTYKFVENNVKCKMLKPNSFYCMYYIFFKISITIGVIVLLLGIFLIIYYIII